MPSIFSFGQIAWTAVIASVVAILALLIMQRRMKALSIGEMVIVALMVGLSVLVWRSAANTASLNDDPIAGVSPNDVLCPVITYVFLGLYAAVRRPMDPFRFEQARAVLTLLSFVVNVVTI